MSDMAPWLPLVTLASLAGAGGYVAALGLQSLWWHSAVGTANLGVFVIVAGALHMTWILPASRRAHSGLVVAAWLTTVYFTALGLTAAGFTAGAPTYALILEGITLAVALSMTEASPWPDRLARWRRSRQRIATELRMTEGIVPWARSCITQLVSGRQARPAASDFERLRAELVDAGEQMRLDVAHLALPDAGRQALLTSAQAIATHAATCAAELSMAVERRTLIEASACRDAIEGLTDLDPAERERVAGDCERLLLELACRETPSITGRRVERRGAAAPAGRAESRGSETRPDSAGSCAPAAR